MLDVPEEPGRPLLQALCSHLKSKRVLLILDNCEHLIKPAADMAHAIVKAAPHVRMIASSREAAARAGREGLPDPAAAGAGPHGQPGGAAALDRGAAVRRTRAGAQAGLRAERARGAGRRRTGGAAGRHPAGAGAGRRAGALAERGRHQHAAEGPLQDPHRRQPRAAGAPADAARAGGLVLRAAERERAADAAPPGGVRRRLRPAGGREGVRRRADRGLRGAGPAGLAGGEVAGHAGGARGGLALPHAGDDPRLCAREAREQDADEAAADGGAALRVLLSVWPRMRSDGLDGAEQADMAARVEAELDNMRAAPWRWRWPAAWTR